MAARHATGLSRCRLCGKDNGSSEFTDGTHQWPEGLAHYVSDHSVRLPRELVEHATRTTAAIEAVSPNLEWWLVRTLEALADRTTMPRRVRGHPDERTGRSDSPLGAVSRSSQALATQIPHRLAERLRVGDLPSG